MKIALILALLLMPIVSAVSDTTPPSIVSFDFEPKVVDVTQSDQDITFTMQLKDDLSGVYGAWDAYFESPSGNQTTGVIFFDSNLVSGDKLNGTYVANTTILQYSERGKWHEFFLAGGDKAGNRIQINNEKEIEKLGFPTVIEVKS